jgi:hypothetical protein
VEVFLGPRRVHLARRAGGWRARPAVEHVAPVEAATDQDWAGAVEALAGALAHLAWRNADAVVTLSNHFVRHALVPPVAGVKRGEREALARHHLRSVYGEAADAWRVALDGGRGDSSSVASAVDAELIDAVEGALRGAGLRPARIEPYLAQAFNGCRGALGTAAAWLAVAEPGRVCVAHLDRGRWRALRAQRTHAPLDVALPPLLEQTRLAASTEVAPGRVHLVVRDQPAVRIECGGGWSVEAVAGHA